MNLIKRLKASYKSFLNPTLIEPNIITNTLEKIVEKPVIQVQEILPKVVFDNQLLLNKNVLITGAGENIGRSIALELAKQGANIYFTNIDSVQIEKLNAELSQYSINYQGFIFDITNLENNDQLVNWLQENEIVIDILVNHVGIQYNLFSYDKVDISAWQKLFNTNIFSPIYLNQKIIKIMIENNVNGSIIFISSIHEEVIFRDASYSASKAAINMIIKEWAVDLAPYQIRVNGVAPGVVKTNPDSSLKYFPYHVLHQSTIDPDYIGRAVLYLASDYFSHFTTGITLKIDAGASLYNYRTAQQSQYDK